MHKAIITSAYRSHRSAGHNELNHDIAGQLLTAQGRNFQACAGAYKGETEKSYIVMIRTPEEFDAVSNIFFVQYKQESILVIDYEDDRRATLIFNDGSRVELGTIREVTPAIAFNCDGYTFINGRYFVAAEEPPSWGECSQTTKEAEPAALHDHDRPDRCHDPKYADPADAGHLPGEGRRS